VKISYPFYFKIKVGLFIHLFILSIILIILPINEFCHLLNLFVIVLNLRSVIQASKFDRVLQIKPQIPFFTFITSTIVFCGISVLIGPINPATKIYHALVIQWFSFYKALPGFGNLTTQYGFNNNSFLLEAYYSMPFLKLGSF